MIAEGDITRCVGDAICLVVAETEDILNKAKTGENRLRGVRAGKRHCGREARGRSGTFQRKPLSDRHVVRGDAAKHWRNPSIP